MPRTKPPYEEEFRREAVDLLISTGRPLKEVADDLGISTSTLRAWRDKAFNRGLAAEAGSAEPKGRSGGAPVDPAAEIRRLQRENEYLRRQREILKKAMSILSEDPQSGMQ